MRRKGIMAIALALCVGCNLQAPGAPVKAGKTPRPTGASPASSPRATASGGPAAPLARLPLDAPPRPLGADAVAVSLTGKVKLISDHGGAIISNNSGGLLGDAGGALVSNNGGGLVSNNGGGLTAKTKYGVLQAPPGHPWPPVHSSVLEIAAAPAAESPLADAEIEFLDASGNVLLEGGKAVMARTDATGAFTFAGKLPAEGLVARVRLWNGGVLLAMLAKHGGGAIALELDTASTLGASYVLDRFVQKRREVLDRLPATEAAALRQDLDAARGLIGARVPSYRPAELVGLADELRSRDAAVGQRIERIKALLLVGQSDLGEGKDARTVALSGPVGIAGDAAGNLYVAELGGGRIRRIGADGRIRRFAGGAATSAATEGAAIDVSLDAPSALAMGPDGTMWVADAIGQRVFAIKDGQVRVAAGTGKREQGAAGRPGPQVELQGPSVVAVGADGQVWIGEQSKSQGLAGRLLRLDREGVLHEAPRPGAGDGFGFAGLAATADGALWALDDKAGAGQVWRQPPGGAWALVAGNLRTNDHSHLCALPDGAVLVSEERGHQIVRLDADGRKAVIAGNGTAAWAGDGGPASAAALNTPTGMWLAPDGALIVAEFGSGVVRRLAPPLDGSGLAATVAGTFGVSQQGDALSIAINTPGGMALDRQGRLVFTESGSNTVKRLEGGKLVVLAGTGKGYAGDGGPATAASLDAPVGLAYVGDDLYVLEVLSLRVRKIDAAGTIATAAGIGARGGLLAPRTPAGEVKMRRPFAAAVGPDGRLYWTDNENNQVCRLDPDGHVTLIAGQENEGADEGDGGPARLARLNKPLGLAFDSRGALYVCDAGNFRVRKITGLDGPEPRIDAFAGIPGLAAVLKLAEPQPAEPVPGAEATLAGPIGIAFDRDDVMYLAELGTTRLNTFLGGSGLGEIMANVPRMGARIRRITGVREGAPMVTTIAGEGTAILNEPGTDNSLLAPFGLLFDPAKGLYVLDTGNNAIKLLPNGTF